MYGDLCHLGIDGYREFKQMRKDIHDKRMKMVENQFAAKKAFIRDITNWSIISVVVFLCVFVIWITIDLIVAYAK
jgi:hypothetical protein